MAMLTNFGGKGILPWSSNLANQPINSPPKVPPYSLLKGSQASMVVTQLPKYPGVHLLRMANSDAELIAPYVPGRIPVSSSSNPAVLAQGPQHQFAEGDEAWISWSFIIPANFPALRPSTPTFNDFLLIGELHGPVYVNGGDVWMSGSNFGSPATALTLKLIGNKEYVCMVRGAPHYDIVWKMPLVRGSLHTVVFHVLFSADPKVGKREVWVNGNRQMTLVDATLHADGVGNTERLVAYQMLYYSKKGYGRNSATTIYHGDMKIGNDLASVS